ncbi:hypothetical protein DPMN_090269 [Dreissena polymorpha]|uniref:Uncharacterized protein n=1 Tax=Dreissena polymorpha TaxID=45954 RepID=A0A9D4QYV8_DREPO|nr:hypothetical protein DPMN_090269 [Dreissena polymorpha]
MVQKYPVRMVLMKGGFFRKTLWQTEYLTSKLPMTGIPKRPVFSIPSRVVQTSFGDTF